MPIFIQNLRDLKLSQEELNELVRLAKKQERIERRWTRQLWELFKTFEELAIRDLVNSGQVSNTHIDFEDLYFKQSMEVAEEAIKSTYRAPRLARMPRSLEKLMDLWDQWRKTGKVPKHQKKIAKEIRKAYLDKVQDVWKKYSRDFREGESFDLDTVQKVIRKQATQTTYSRAKTIVQTEGTKYWNQTRRQIYDMSPDVTHYLYVAIRDAATTKWCRSRNGLVFTKDSKLFDTDGSPPVHWNCRSEILPLSPLSPKQKRLIDDKSLRAENNHLEPLPKGWRAG